VVTSHLTSRSLCRGGGGTAGATYLPLALAGEAGGEDLAEGTQPLDTSALGSLVGRHLLQGMVSRLFRLRARTQRET
jgi:hypothetical protein